MVLPSWYPVRLFLVVAALICLSSSQAAFAQPGTVSFDATYPKEIKAPNNMDDGAVDVLGSYTVNQGYSLLSIHFHYWPMGGGMPVDTTLDTLNGKVGKHDNNQIVDMRIMIPQGQYQCKMVAIYSDPNGTMPIVYSTTKNITITH